MSTAIAQSQPGKNRSAFRVFISRSSIGALALVLLMAGLVQLPVRAQLNDSVVLFGDQLEQGLQNWSWAATSMDATDQTANGSAAAMSVDFGPWEGMYLGANDGIVVPPNATLVFLINAGQGNADPVEVKLFDAAQNPGPGVMITPTPGAWQTVEIPLTDLGGFSSLGGIWWQDQSGNSRPTMYVDEVRLVAGEPPEPVQGPALSINLGSSSLTRAITDPASGQVTNQTVAFPHQISEGVYGMNFAAPQLRDELSIGVNRWGGNGVERYNYTTGATNIGHDWFFMNSPGNPDDPNNFEADNQAIGAETIMTMPMTGWVSRDSTARCGYPVNDFFGTENNMGAMDAQEPHFLDGNVLCGNGERGGNTVYGANPNVTSIPAGPEYVTNWVTDLVQTHGDAASGGVEMYALGNEPGLWHVTHSDVRDTPVGRTELIDTNIAYATAIKQADPTAQVLGPVLWSGYSYFVTSEEFANGQRPGDVSTFVGDWLNSMAAAEASSGTRLVDTLAVNFYDDRVYGGGTDALRLESTRNLWDPTYAPNDWWVVRDFLLGNGYSVIPRLQSLIDTNYPGTQLALTEYNFGGFDTMAGGLAQADALGIFGREGVDTATVWEPWNAELSPSQEEVAAMPGHFAFRMYRNYDGNGSRFGDQAVLASSTDQSAVSVYASKRNDGALTVMVINKATTPQTSALSIEGGQVGDQMEVFQYDSSNVNEIVGLGTESVGTRTYPARSMTLLVIQPGDEEPTPEPTTPPTPEPTTPPTPEPTTPPTPEPTTTPVAGSSYRESFETADHGWTLIASCNPGADGGNWERAQPERSVDPWSPVQLDEVSHGSFAMVTGGQAGNDVDGGLTALLSPPIAVPTGSNVFLELDYYFAHLGDADDNDFFRFTVVGENESVVVIEEYANGRSRSAFWSTRGTIMNQFRGQNVQFLVEVSDAGDDSTVEAAIDNVRLLP